MSIAQSTSSFTKELQSTKTSETAYFAVNPKLEVKVGKVPGTWMSFLKDRIRVNPGGKSGDTIPIMAS